MPQSTIQFEYHTLGIDQIDLVQPLWEKLRAEHVLTSVHFPDELRSANFQRRKAAFTAKSNAGGLHIDLVSLPGTRDYIAYSIASLSPEKQGEIDSIFVEEAHRSAGIGSALMQRALAWLDKNGALRKSVVVLIENEPAIRFYTRFGFHLRTATLVQTPPPK
jgi:GNAT superfamily N-acetyltransferase